MRIANSQHDADMRERWVGLARQWRSLAAQVEELGLGDYSGDGASSYGVDGASERTHKPEK
jgi:hypothetical protein